MLLHVLVCFDLLADFNESLEERLIITVVEGLLVDAQVGNVPGNRENIRRVNDLFFQSFTVLSD